MYDEGRQWVRPSDRSVTSMPTAMSRPSSSSLAPSSSMPHPGQIQQYSTSLIPLVCQQTPQQETHPSIVRSYLHDVAPNCQPPQYTRTSQAWAQDVRKLQHSPAPCPTSSSAPSQIDQVLLQQPPLHASAQNLPFETVNKDNTPAVSPPLSAEAQAKIDCMDAEGELELLRAAIQQKLEKKRKRQESEAQRVSASQSIQSIKLEVVESGTEQSLSSTPLHAVPALSSSAASSSASTNPPIPAQQSHPLRSMQPQPQQLQDPFLQMLSDYAHVDARFDYVWSVVDRGLQTPQEWDEFHYCLEGMNQHRARFGLPPLWGPQNIPITVPQQGSIVPPNLAQSFPNPSGVTIASVDATPDVKRQKIKEEPGFASSPMAPPASSPSSHDMRQVTTALTFQTPLSTALQQLCWTQSSTAPDTTPTAQPLELSTPAPPPSTAAITSHFVPVPAPVLSEPVLSPEQVDLVDLICSRQNVFYTGSAGTGKSTILKAFVKRMRDDMKMQVDIIAPTGRAALDVNGSTFWTYAGWTPNNLKKPIEELETDAWFQKFVRKRLQKTNVLVFDEISMVENNNFERLNRILKAARKSSMPFGGVQLVVTGDFCQLPPVKPFQYCIECGKEMMRSLKPATFKCHSHGTIPDTDKWAFKSRAWREANFQHVELTKIHRQSDETFIKILQKLRIGDELTQDDRDLLLHHPCQVTEHNAVRLFPTLAEVKRVNDEAFAKLRPMPRRFTCLDDATIYNHHPHLKMKAQRLPDGSLTALREHRLEAAVDYKLGMRVVLLANLDLNAGLVNGSQGTIIKWERHADKNLPKAWENISKEMRGKYPTIGCDDDGSPVKGKSKATFPANTDGTLPSIMSGDYAAHREYQINAFIKMQAHQEWPVVQFKTAKGVITRTIYADCRVNELGDEKPYSHLSRTQIPLVAAWAMTIHKSQGMTLDMVVVDLSRSFEQGQEYVALSRARALEGLKVEGLGVGGEGNKEVREFLEGHFGGKV